MSLRLAEEMIFHLCARSHANLVDIYTISYIRAHILSVGLSNVRKLACLTSEESYCILDLYKHDGHWIGSIFTSDPYDSILLH
jgi:hypothetical protein